MIGRIEGTKSNGRSINVGTTAQANWKISAARRNFAHLCARPWWCPCSSALIIVSYQRKMINHSGRRCTQWCQPNKQFIITTRAKTQVFVELFIWCYVFNSWHLFFLFFFFFIGLSPYGPINSYGQRPAAFLPFLFL